MAERKDGQQRVSASTWAGIATLAGTALLLYTGAMTGEWRGVAVSVVQVLVVGLTTWFVLRND
jgi:hypothetical protein